MNSRFVPLSANLVRHYDIEVVDACNLACPSCPRGNSLEALRPKGHMKPDQLDRILGKIVRENPQAESIGLYNWGEPLLHPNLPEMIRLVHRYGLKCSISTNLNIAKNLDEIVAAAPDSIRISLSGFNQDVYGRTHLKGDIEVVKSNMAALAASRAKQNAQIVIEALYHVYLHNLDPDFFQMQQLCQDLGFVMHGVYAFLMPLEKSLAYFEGNATEDDRALVSLMAVRPEEMKAISKSHSGLECKLQLEQFAINSDGSVPLCCATYDRKFDIAPHFEDLPLIDLQARRAKHDLCRNCMSNALHISAHYVGMDSWHRAAQRRFAEIGLDVQLSSPTPPFIQVDTIRARKVTSLPSIAAATSSDHAPRLSVLIPTFNRVNMLRECVQSVQTTTVDCEIVVMDNASEDGTQEMMEAFAKADPRIRYIRHDRNIGGTENFVEIMKAARGESICILGDDDAVLPGNFERKLSILNDHPEVGLVYSMALRTNGQGIVEGPILWPGLLSYSYVGGRSEFNDLLPASYMLLQTVVFRRSLYDEQGGFEELPDACGGADWDLLLRYCRNTTTAYIAEPMACVRYHDGMISESHKSTGKFARGRIAVWRKWLVDNSNPPVLDERTWDIMRCAFKPDLAYEFGEDAEKIAFYLSELEAVRRDSIDRIGSRAASNGVSHNSPSAHRPVQRTQAGPNPTGSDAWPLTWVGPVFDPSGYADEARQFLLGLEEQALAPSLHAVPWSSRIADLAPVEEATLRAMGRRPYVPGGIVVNHLFAPHFKRREEAAVNVGRTMYETDRLPEGWADACNSMDRIWVPSEFNRQSFTNAGVDESKIAVIPGAIDTTRYHRGVNPMPIEGSRGFNFLSVFDWSLRKGWDVLLKAYLQAFNPTDNVALILKVHSSYGKSVEDIAAEVTQFLVHALNADLDRIPDIVFQGGDIPEADMPSLYAAADCFVLPTRGEGWGRPFMESMACGVPAIGTDWSGQTAFMNDGNSLLVDYELEDVPDVACLEAPAMKGHQWAEPSVKSLVQQMRRALEDRSWLSELGSQASHEIHQLYSRESVTKILMDEIDLLRSQFGPSTLQRKAA